MGFLIVAVLGLWLVLALRSIRRDRAAGRCPGCGHCSGRECAGCNKANPEK